MGFWLFGHQKGDYDPDLLAYVARRSMELMRSFTGQNLATIIWATRRCKGIMNYYQMLCLFEFFGTSFFWKDTISIVFGDTRYLYVTDFFLMAKFRSRNDCYVSNPSCASKAIATISYKDSPGVLGL